MTKKIEILIIILLLVSIPVGINFYAKSSKTAEKAMPIPPVSQNEKPPTEQPATAQTTLAFSPSSYTLSSASGSLTIDIATGENKVTAAQVEISYDQNMLTNVAILPGTFFQNPIELLKNIDSKNGKIFYAIVLSPTGQAKNGSGTLATITFTSKLAPNQKTKLQFLPKTLVTAEGIRTTVLKTTADATITKQ